MLGETPWFGHLALLAFYLVFEGVYRTFRKKFLATHMLEELLGTIRKLKKERGSDNEGAQLCAWVVATYLIISPIFIVIFCIASLVKQQSSKDILLCVVLLVFWLPTTLALDLVNELFMSWKKKIRIKQ